MMIEVRKTYNGNSITLSVYVFTSRPYTINYNVGVKNPGNQNEVAVPLTTTSVVMTVVFTDNSETIQETYSVTDGIKTYLFQSKFGIEKKRENIYVSGYIKSHFPGWSTAGITDFSSVSRLFSPLLVGLFCEDVEKIVRLLEGNKGTYFPIAPEKITKSTENIFDHEETLSTLFFNHLVSFSEEAMPNTMRKTCYLTGKSTVIGNNNRMEVIDGDPDYVYETKLKYGKNNLIPKSTVDFVNHQIYPNFIFRETGPVNTTVDGHFLSLSNGTSEVKFYSPDTIASSVVTNFGDVFILNTTGNLKYGKLEIDIPDFDMINPSINNNNIVSVSSDYFTPTEEVEVIVDFEYLRRLGAKSIVVKVKNQSETYYLIDNHTLTVDNTSISIPSSTKSMQTLITTEATDRYISVEVFVDGDTTPYLAYSAAYLLDLVDVNSNIYQALSVIDNNVAVVRGTTTYKISAKYHGHIRDGDDYVHFEI